MARREIKVTIARRNIDLLLKLAANILQRHADMGPASPLNGQLDVAALTDLHNRALAARNEAVKTTAAKEALNEKARAIIGMAKGQTRLTTGTLYWHVNRVHHFMKFHYKGNEEQAGLWGFKVTIGRTKGRRDVRFRIPIGSAPGLAELAGAIINKHLQEGAGSILTAPLFDMAAMQAAHTEAVQLRDEAKQNGETGQASNELARNLGGCGKGQTAQTPDTLYYNIIRVRDLLLTVYTGNEEQLGLWGYGVRVR